jgi:hypothetical protein
MAKRKGPRDGGPGSSNSNISNGNDSTGKPDTDRVFDSDTAWFCRNSQRPRLVRRARPSDAFFDEFSSTDPAIEKWLVIRPDTFSWHVITVLVGGRR